MQLDAPKPRLKALDALRGLVMIIMALDHVRDFIHEGALANRSPEDLATTTPLLFMTRWFTHFCAPVFVVSAGMGAYFWWNRGHRSRGQLARYLWTRGLWLILLELTILRFALFFELFEDPVLLTILWALGASMVALGFLIFLPLRVLGPLSLLVILTHNLFDSLPASPLVTLLHRQGAIQLGPVPVVIGYPLIPWIFVMSAGFCLAPWIGHRRLLIGLGLGMSIGWVLLRAWNVYGDPAPWSTQSTPIMTELSFLRCTKYPPSLQFLLMTLGPALLALAWFQKFEFSSANPLIVYGRVPLFYFVMHFLLAHAVAEFVPLPGHGLGTVYLVWVSIVVGLYPVCRWFAGVKQRHRDWWWLSYL